MTELGSVSIIICLLELVHHLYLAGLEVAEKFLGGWVGQVTTMSNLNLSCIELELRLGCDNKSITIFGFCTR